MDSHKPAKVTSPIISLSDGYVKTIPLALIVGAVGLVLSLALGGFDTKQFLYIYLTNFCFVLTIGLGCLFFVIVMHLTRAGWSATIRRIAELLRHVRRAAVYSTGNCQSWSCYRSTGSGLSLHLGMQRGLVGYILSDSSRSCRSWHGGSIPPLEELKIAVPQQSDVFQRSESLLYFVSLGRYGLVLFE